MKIACVDKSAADRLKLQERLEEAYLSARSAIGHLPLSQLVPLSKEELLLTAGTGQTSPGAIIIGPAYTVEEAAACCRDLMSAHPSLPLVLVVTEENYSLRTLRRFEPFTRDVFSVDDSSVRLVHTLSQLEERRQRKTRGKLVVVDGVKGGVGATSIVGALAHAAEALGRSAAIADLSQAGSLVHYAGAARWQSSDYTTALIDLLSPDEDLLDRCTAKAPNGLHLLLPPSGNTDIRELWLRDPKRLEITFGIVDLLLERFDIVLVDSAASEGVLPFALRARANLRLLITSNEPASVHLLSRRLQDLSQTPGDGPVYILINALLERGLSKDDILDFLILNKHFNEEMTRLRPIPYDSQARNWIGTGNTFYTEARRATQRTLELCLTKLFNPEQVLAAQEEELDKRVSFSARFKALPWPNLRPKRIQKALPFIRERANTRAAAPAAVPEASREIQLVPPHEERLASIDLYQPPSLISSN